MSQPAPAQSRLQFVQTWTEFAALGDEWDALLAESTVGCTFLTWDWVDSWAFVHDGVAEPFVLLCRDEDGALIGIVPLVRLRNTIASKLVRIVRFLGDIGDDANNFDIIARAGREADVVSSMLSALESSPSTWDVLDLRQVPAESPALPRLIEGVRQRGWIVTETRVPHLVLDLPSTWEAFLKRLSSNTRWRLSRNATLLAAEGVLAYRECETAGDIATYLDALFALHAQRWALRGQRPGPDEQVRRRFYDRVTPRLLDRHRLELDMLELDGRPIAAQLGFHYGDTYHALHSAFDPSFARFSPSVALASKIVCRLLARGIRHYDYLHGDEPYKLRWLPRKTTYARLVIVRPGSLGARYVSLAGVASAGRARVRDRFPSVWARLRGARNLFRSGGA